MNNILKIIDLKKEYRMGDVVVEALRGATFSVAAGEFVVILGPSGSGKSTLLNIAGGIDTPTSGEVIYRGEDISKYSPAKLTEYRRRAVGFVFQFYNLMTNLTARENVDLVAELSSDPIDTLSLLELVDMTDRADHFPSQLSGGQQQRVAIARAVAKNPDILLCDEPTGALDVATGISVLKALRDFNKRYGKTVIIITHNASIGEMGDRVLTVRDGRIAHEERNDKPLSPEEVVW